MNQALFSASKSLPQEAKVTGTMLFSEGKRNETAQGVVPPGAPLLQHLHCQNTHVTGIPQPVDLVDLDIVTADFAASQRKRIPQARAAVAAACKGSG